MALEHGISPNCNCISSRLGTLQALQRVPTAAPAPTNTARRTHVDTEEAAHSLGMRFQLLEASGYPVRQDWWLQAKRSSNGMHTLQGCACIGRDAKEADFPCGNAKLPLYLFARPQESMQGVKEG